MLKIHRIFIEYIEYRAQIKILKKTLIFKASIIANNKKFFQLLLSSLEFLDLLLYENALHQILYFTFKAHQNKGVKSMEKY
jgi:hypothetical protein